MNPGIEASHAGRNGLRLTHSEPIGIKPVPLSAGHGFVDRNFRFEQDRWRWIVQSKNWKMVVKDAVFAGLGLAIN